MAPSAELSVRPRAAEPTSLTNGGEMGFGSARESTLAAAAPLTQKPVCPHRMAHAPRQARPVRASTTPSKSATTLARTRASLEDFAAGRRVREIKRMGGMQGIWTLRAGIGFRVIIRESRDVLEVIDLVAREGLETTLANLARTRGT